MTTALWAPLTPDQRAELDDLASFCRWIGLGVIANCIEVYAAGSDVYLEQSRELAAMTAAANAAGASDAAELCGAPVSCWATLSHIADRLSWLSPVLRESDAKRRAEARPLAKTDLPDLSIYDSERDTRETADTIPPEDTVEPKP